MSLPPQPLTGRMPSVCSWCGDTYGQTPCIPEMHGEVTHGVCPACYPAVAEKFAREAKDYQPVPRAAHSQP